MRKILRRFITWLYVRYVVVPEFKAKLKKIAETEELLDTLLGGYEVEFTPDDEFMAKCQEKLH
jgi:hypothetical protein